MSILANAYNELILKIDSQQKEIESVQKQKNDELATINAELKEKIDETYTMQVKSNSRLF